MKRLLLIAAFLFTTTLAVEAESPYAGQQNRDIKALSPAEIEGYLNGKGMGMAKAAELNGYPGPKHVLELAVELELTADQVEKTEALYERMHADAVQLGERIVAKERQLDRSFASNDIDGQSLVSALQTIGDLKARLRNAHLAVHLEQRALMRESQIERYKRLRGYADRRTGHHAHH